MTIPSFQAEQKQPMGHGLQTPDIDAVDENIYLYWKFHSKYYQWYSVSQVGNRKIEMFKMINNN